MFYYPRCLGNKVLCWTSHIATCVVLSPSYTYASMLHFGDEDGILYIHEDAWEIQWSFDFPCVRKKGSFSTEATWSKFEHVLSKWRESDCLVVLANSALSERLFVPMWKEWKCSSWQIISWKKQARATEEAILAVTNRKRAIFLTEIGPDAY